MKEIVNRLKAMLLWSDRMGSDEIFEINDLISIAESTILYTKADMEKSFIAGGKLCFNMEHDDFDTFIDKLKKDV